MVSSEPLVQAGPSRRRRWYGVVIATAALAVVAGSGFLLARSAVKGSQPVLLPTAGRPLPPAERLITPAVSGTTLEGRPLDVASLRGAPVAINFWGSWCVPCREEMPELVALAAETEPLGVRFVGVNIRDNRAAAQAFARRFKVPYPSLFDPGNQIAIRFAPMLPRGTPATYVLDAHGRVAWVYFGRIRYRELRSVLVTVAGEKRA